MGFKNRPTLARRSRTSRRRAVAATVVPPADGDTQDDERMRDERTPAPAEPGDRAAVGSARSNKAKRKVAVARVRGAPRAGDVAGEDEDDDVSAGELDDEAELETADDGEDDDGNDYFAGAYDDGSDEDWEVGSVRRSGASASWAGRADHLSVFAEPRDRRLGGDGHDSAYSLSSQDADDSEPEPFEIGPSSIDEYVDGMDEAIGAIVLRIAEIIRDVAPNAQERIKWGMPHYAESGHLAYIDAKLDHVNLGFFRGDELADNENARNLLQGAGGKLRHIRLYSVHSVPESAIRSLIAAAVELNRDISGL